MSKLSLMDLRLIIFVIKLLNCLEFSMRRPGSGSMSTFMSSHSAVFATLVTPSRNIFSNRPISGFFCPNDDGNGGGTGPPGSVDRCFAPIFFASLMHSIVCSIRISLLSSIQEGWYVSPIAYSVNALRFEICMLDEARVFFKPLICSSVKVGAYACGTSHRISTPLYPTFAISLIESSREYCLKALVLNASLIMLLLWLPGKLWRLLEELVGIVECYALNFIDAKAGFPHLSCYKWDTEWV